MFCKSINEEFGRIDLLADEEDAEKYRRHLRSPKPYLNLSQVEFEKVLARHAESEPKIEIQFGNEWTSFLTPPEGEAGEGDHDIETVVSRVRDRQTGQEQAIRSQFVIAADGAASPIRKALGIAMKGPDKLQDFINVYFEHNLRPDVETPAKLYWILHPAAPGAFIAHHIEKRWTYNLPLATPWETRDDYSEEVLRERIITALGFDPGLEIKSVSYWRMTVQIAEHYRRGRVFLVGDSAHRFPPTGGLGMNTGIGDAHNLAWKIASVLEQGAPLRLLDSYELERRPIAKRNAEESAKNHAKIFEVLEAFGLPAKGLEMTARLRASFPFKLLPTGLVERCLDLVRRPAHKKLGRFHSDPALRKRVQSAIADQIGHFDRIGLDIGYAYQSGALIAEEGATDRAPAAEPPVTEYRPSAEPGARFPHVGLTATTSSHDLIDYADFALLTGSDSEAWRQAAERLGETTGMPLRVVPLDQLPGNSESRHDPEALQTLEDLCDLGPDGALLLRPDGHVAWRVRECPADPSAELASVFETLAVKAC